MTIAVDGKYTPTEWFTIAAAKKMKIISWTFNRGFSLPGGGWYYSETADITDTHGDQFELLDVLYKAGLYGLFSDYPEFVSFYMSCIVDDFASKGSGSEGDGHDHGDSETSKLDSDSSGLDPSPSSSEGGAESFSAYFIFPPSIWIVFSW